MAAESSKQLKVQKLASRAPAGFTAEEQANVALHFFLQAKFAAVKAADRAHHTAIIDNHQAQLDQAKDAADTSAEEIVDSWQPVATRHNLEPTELSDSCWNKALAEGVYNAGEDAGQGAVCD